MFFPIKNNLKEIEITVGWRSHRTAANETNTINPGETVYVDATNQFLFLIVPPNTLFKLYPYEGIAFIFYQVKPNHPDFDNRDVYVYLIDKNNSADLSTFETKAGKGGVGDPDDDLPIAPSS